MVSEVKQEDNAVVLRFGGGVHSRASEDEIDPRECASGENFLLDVQNRNFRNRPPFDLVATAPNAAEIRGGGQLIKQDGTTSFIVQAGGNVYEMDENYSFTLAGTCNSNAKLRGWHWHNFTLDDTLILTDINDAQPVMTWDGTTLAAMGHDLGGDFYARYCFVRDERAFYGNIISGTAVPHMIAISALSDFDALSIADRPGGAGVNEADPVFVLTPDLRPVNGLLDAFGTVVVSSKGPYGNMYNITGTNADTYLIEDFYVGSGAAGDEPMAYVGNDVVYGRQGRIESLISTDRYGDVEADDLTAPVKDLVEAYPSWRIVYNSRLDRVYCEAIGQSELWVLNKAMLSTAHSNPVQQSGLSPWAKWTTRHPVAFSPTFMMPLLDPSDGLEYVWFGDEAGNLFRMEGTGSSGDGGSYNINCERFSALFSAPLDSDAYDIQGWVRYRATSATRTLTLRFEYEGDAAFNEEITISLPGLTGGNYFNGSAYFGGDFYFGLPFDGKLTRRKYAVAGQANEFQVRAIIDGTDTFEVNEIGIRFSAG